MNTRTSNTRLRVFLLLLCIGALATMGELLRPSASARGLHPSTSAASVATDKSDYLPGETVTITGSGWQAGETVSLTIVENDGDEPWYSSALADDSGNINNSAFVIQTHDLGVSFTVTATGGSSGQTATAVFTDGNGTGKVTITSADGSCVAGTLPSGGGPLTGKLLKAVLHDDNRRSDRMLRRFNQGVHTK